MALAKSLVLAAGRNAPPVICNLERQLASLPRDADGAPRSLRVPGDVGQQLPGQREHEVVLVTGGVLTDAHRVTQASTSRVLAGDRGQRRFQVALLERDGVQRHDGVPQPIDRPLERLVRPGDAGATRGRFDQVLVG